MFVTPNSISSSDYPVYVYGLEGKPLRTLRFDNIRFPGFFTTYDDDHLLFYNDRISIAEPYGLISKTDTTITYLPVRFGGRETMTVTRTAEGSSMSYTFGNPIAKTRDGYIFSEPGIDTLYRWSGTQQKLTPIMTRTPSFSSMEYPIGLFWWQESSDYIFLETFERKFDFDTYEGGKNVPLIYDKRSGEFFEGSVVNADYADPKVVPYNASDSAGVPAGVFVVALQPYELLDLHEQGKLRGRLAEIAPTLKEDDNPVMMIVTFK
jgi:hypothetical protein